MIFLGKWENLEQLLAKVTTENVHIEMETGPATGNEVW
jgi:hypothetical protein